MEQTEATDTSSGQPEDANIGASAVPPSGGSSATALSPQAGGGTCHCGCSGGKCSCGARVESEWQRGDDVLVRLRARPHRATVPAARSGEGVRSSHGARPNQRANGPPSPARSSFGASEPVPGAAALLDLHHRGPRDIHPATSRSGGLRPTGHCAAADTQPNGHGRGHRPPRPKCRAGAL